jgi:hypothetical protein
MDRISMIKNYNKPDFISTIDKRYCRRSSEHERGSGSGGIIKGEMQKAKGNKGNDGPLISPMQVLFFSQTERPGYRPIW